jgi:hypothetical protein
VFEIPADRIYEAKVIRTLLEGKMVYEAGRAGGQADGRR